MALNNQVGMVENKVTIGSKHLQKQIQLRLKICIFKQFLKKF